MSARSARALLERLAHHDVLDMSDTHSREGKMNENVLVVWHFKHGLAARRLHVFRAIHHDALRAALDGLPARGDAEVMAVRGRLLRLLGDVDAARRALEASLALSPSAPAAGWLGELDVFTNPERALRALRRARELDPSWTWPKLWRAAAHLQKKNAAAASRELDAVTERDPGFVYRMLRFQALIMRRDHAGALAQAEAAIRLDPSSPGGYDMAGKALHRLGRSAAALARWHQARERDLDVAGAYAFEGINLDSTWKEPSTYLAELDAAAARHPRLAPLYAERAELKRDPRLCRYEEALEDYARAVRLEPRRAWLWAVWARAKNNLRGGREGLAEFDQAARLAPDCGWIRAWRGALRARLGLRRGALADFAAAEEAMPWYPFTYAWRGALWNRLGRFADARRDLDLAIRLDPHYTFSHYERYRALRGLKDFAGAVRDLNHAFAADPKYTWLGPASGPGARPAALRELDAAVRSAPRLAWLHAWRGYCRMELGRPAAALADLDRALALEKDSGLMHAWRGRARREAGRPGEAAKDLARAVRLSPGLWAAHQELAQLHESGGDLKKALASMAVVTRLAPTTVSCLLAKARLELSLQRPDDALADLDRALQLDAGYAEARGLKARALLTRGLARQKSGDLKGQIADFRRALELSPELFSAEERRAVARLVGAGAR